jgi:hypothetical protein
LRLAAELGFARLASPAALCLPPDIPRKRPPPLPRSAAMRSRLLLTLVRESWKVSQVLDGLKRLDRLSGRSGGGCGLVTLYACSLTRRELARGERLIVLDGDEFAGAAQIGLAAAFRPPRVTPQLFCELANSPFGLIHRRYSCESQRPLPLQVPGCPHG